MAISSVKKTTPTRPNPAKLPSFGRGQNKSYLEETPKVERRIYHKFGGNRGQSESLLIDSLYIRPTYYLLGTDFAAHDIIDAIGD